MKKATHHGQLISTIILKLTLYQFAFQQVHKSNGIWTESANTSKVRHSEFPSDCGKR